MFNIRKMPLIQLLPLLLVTAFALSSCSSKQKVYNPNAVEKKKVEKVGEVKAQITKQKPRETVVYQPESPELYTVQKGDTLWDISTHFLRDAWLWPEIWYKNPQIDNPHLIYPGDQLAIIYVGGQKRVQLVKRGEVFDQTKGLKVVKISPRIHSKPIDSSIPSIPIESIRQFISRPLLIGEEELANSAYILASKDDRLASGSNNVIYARGINAETSQGKYHVFRPNKEIKDLVTGDTLGYEALFLGEAKILKHGDPASLRIVSSNREILRDDRLIPINNSDIERDLFPKPPEEDIKGQVISLVDGISQVGQFNTIAINLGSRDDIQVGHLVAINVAGKAIRDLNEDDPNFLIQLPDERSSLAIVIKTYDRMSYCLILSAKVPVKIGDLVVTP